MHALGEEICGKFRLHDLQALVNQPKTSVNSVHGAANIPGAFHSDKMVEKSKGLDLAASRVQEWRTKDVHSLDINCGIPYDTSGRAWSVGLLCNARRCVHQKLHVPSPGRRWAGARLHFRVVQLPCHRIQQSNETCLCYAAFEEGIGSESAKGIIADLGVGGGAAAVDKSEVVIGWEGRDMKKNEPKVNPIGRLKANKD
jgi:hypothetical protein